jgi:hypothetical protein
LACIKVLLALTPFLSPRRGRIAARWFETTNDNLEQPIGFGVRQSAGALASDRTVESGPEKSGPHSKMQARAEAVHLELLEFVQWNAKRISDLKCQILKREKKHTVKVRPQYTGVVSPHQVRETVSITKLDYSIALSCFTTFFDYKIDTVLFVLVFILTRI